MIYVIFALIGLLVYQDYMNRKEVKRLIDAFIAKNLRELNERPIKPISLSQEEKPEDIPLSEASPEEFDKAIKAELGQEPVSEKIKRVIKRKVYGR